LIKLFLKFKNKSKLVDGKYDINGELTIKGITNPVVFTLIPGDGNYIANLTFDRIKFDVTYNSGSFIENLGDRLILDEVELEVSLVY
jgi:polyisoprenoid-binding protein YceI